MKFNNVGIRLKEIRENKGLSIEDLASKAGMGAEFIHKIESDGILVEEAAIQQLADALEVSFEALAGARRNASKKSRQDLQDEKDEKPLSESNTELHQSGGDIPTKNDLGKLPLRMIVAYAARCARRVQKWYDTGDQIHSQAVDQAIENAERFARGEEEARISGNNLVSLSATDAADDAEGLGNSIAMRAAEAAAAANAAVLAILEGDPDKALRPAARAADRSVKASKEHTASKSFRMVRLAIKSDFAKLRNLSNTRRENFPDLGAPCEPNESGPLGPLWPEGESQPPLLGDSIDSVRNAREHEKCLNVAAYARSLATYFDATSKDLCFALFGHWGRGKTFLMDEVAKLLHSKNYATVKFSAWKYRSTPQLWAYLYETIAREARTDPWYYRWSLPWRTGIARHGWGVFIGAVIFFGLGLAGWVSPADVGLQWAIASFGFIGCLSFFLLGCRAYLSGRRLHKKYGRLPTHQHTLGLQAVIENDIRALIVAIIPQRTWTSRRPRWSWMKNWAKGSRKLTLFEFIYHVLLGVCYMLSVAGVLWWLQIYSPNASYFWCASALWLVAAVVLPLWVAVLTPQKKRLLLVVDDLDRCPLMQMLEVSESLMIMLDNPEIKARLQVCMLLEERSIRCAMKKKYEDLIPKGDKEGHTEKEIVSDNLEKLFLAHFRLTPVDDSGLKELLEKYTKPTNRENNFSPLSGIGSSDNDPEPEPPKPSADDGKKREGEKSPATTEDAPAFTDEERNILSDKVLKSTRKSRWGPRSVRCFLARYQLARTLLKELGHQADPDELVEALLRADPGPGEVQSAHTTHTLIQEIANSVS